MMAILLRHKILVMMRSRYNFKRNVLSIFLLSFQSVAALSLPPQKQKRSNSDSTPLQNRCLSMLLRMQK